MSKTVEIQIEKSRILVEGLRRHVKEMGERGVTNDEINAMEHAVKELEAVNTEVDSIRAWADIQFTYLGSWMFIR